MGLYYLTTGFTDVFFSKQFMPVGVSVYLYLLIVGEITGTPSLLNTSRIEIISCGDRTTILGSVCSAGVKAAPLESQKERFDYSSPPEQRSVALYFRSTELCALFAECLVLGTIVR